MKVTILGCYAATPRTLTHPTSQVLEIKNHLFLIDCGEGTQVQLRKQKVRFSKINHIFISHLHGDHFFGLPGLVATFRLLGRVNPLHIYGPKGIKEAVTLLLKLGDSWTNYPLHFHELSSQAPEVVFEDKKVTVTTIPLDHRVYTNGFLFREKVGSRKLEAQAVEAHGIDSCYFQNIKDGKDAPNKAGEIIPNAQLSSDPKPTKSYAFCSDTAYFPKIIAQIKEVTVLYHESTFLESESDLATKTKHSTASQAAKIAESAGVKSLILGHYSTRYDGLQPFKEEAEVYFKPVLLADDGREFEF
ncbi:ribonuclease Z [Flavobacteriaceae bacterium]|nr:ribonuclease Z [Flavobacteria bacterium MS024-3C]KRO81118.1 MAG: ribonuclease Z [Polaribacter sp. BACL8 MAG-120531-bin13]KRP02710.1 MAG: ribonuclease Z [Polaribacter sp. BACL8 MAG-120619-bin41]KRP14888.1 MAG: ribonuclease Z [Polaribacter sp. BACL8 MAG-120419-bin8]MBT4839107.1 ribonuclease Z [Flavobacteriaceae bacterium]NQV63539.1 ribonuclease Z [Cryomorphaceae bacterium]